jgi:hypothetical protein
VLYRFAADALVVIHLAFIAFVLCGGLLALRWPRAACLHLPAALWGVLLELFQLPCPLTPWEQRLREAAGEGGYSGGFIPHYLLPLIYPAGLTPEIQRILAAVVIVVNAVVYGWLLRRRRRARRGKSGSDGAQGG